MEAHVFRIVQEALNNISKHADANVASVGLNINCGESVLKLVITDDGVGIKCESNGDGQGARNEKRLGVLGMRERVELLNGEMNLENSAGQGTTLEIRIPIPSQAGQQDGETR